MSRRARQSLSVARMRAICFGAGLSLLLFASFTALSQTFDLPDRPAGAPAGSQVAEQIVGLDLHAREERLFSEIISGNVPQFLRRLYPVHLEQISSGQTNHATIFVTPDYLAVGSDADYFIIPLSPFTAQRVADALHCSLPTPRMVDAIYTQAEVHLSPSPIPPGPAMTTVAVFSNHNTTIWGQRRAELSTHPLGALVAGHKKDVVLSARLANAPAKVAIYGWHKTNGVPIQPLYLGHAAEWVDYSQCIRLVAQQMLLNGQTQEVSIVLSNPVQAKVLSDEGVLAQLRYNSSTNSLSTSEMAPSAQESSAPSIQFESSRSFAERTASLTLEPDVKVHINAPLKESFAPGRKVLLIIYALPNGNTTAQTIGRAVKLGDDWHYDIQHIGAQTRFLRNILTNDSVVIVYLENSLKSWPTWRKQHGDSRIPNIIANIRAQFADYPLEIALTGHSGGGSFIFGYLNAIEKIPDEVVRLAFLDSNYAYDSQRKHDQKIATWLNAGEHHCLSVLAYDDANALLNGKPFVSATGGTWGKSHEMQRDLAWYFRFTSQTNAEFQKFSALNGRIQLILKENPRREILHTVQVERNGFIHALLTATPFENQGYEYFGARAYSQYIAPE